MRCIAHFARRNDTRSYHAGETAHDVAYSKSVKVRAGCALENDGFAAEDCAVRSGLAGGQHR
jgi:hypothetical protein